VRRDRPRGLARASRRRTAVARARGREERQLAPEVDLDLFTPEERAALFSADAKIEAQRRAPGLLPDATVLTEPERIAVCKYLVLGHYGEWHPEFAYMTDAQVRDALDIGEGTR
jgi:hypothetical protein